MWKNMLKDRWTKYFEEMGSEVEDLVSSSINLLSFDSRAVNILQELGRLSVLGH